LGVSKNKVPLVMRYRIAGFKPSEIAEYLGVSPSAISHTIKDPGFIAEYEEHMASGFRTVLERRESFINAAASAFAEIVYSADASPADRLKAARELADRCGWTREQTLKVTQDGDTVPVVLGAPSAKPMAPTVAKPDEE